ncbi:hypothetical protein Dip518_000439 [Parelusimicrobium proximum]|uniref:hypothetical protein n=1 Tax=Parelusimicrobium proximum TaxID=3228953 RepID=UPI003D186843
MKKLFLTCIAAALCSMPALSSDNKPAYVIDQKYDPYEIITKQKNPDLIIRLSADGNICWECDADILFKLKTPAQFKTIVNAITAMNMGGKDIGTVRTSARIQLYKYSRPNVKLLDGMLSRRSAKGQSLLKSYFNERSDIAPYLYSLEKNADLGIISETLKDFNKNYSDKKVLNFTQKMYFADRDKEHNNSNISVHADWTKMKEFSLVTDEGAKIILNQMAKNYKYQKKENITSPDTDKIIKVLNREDNLDVAGELKKAGIYVKTVSARGDESVRPVKSPEASISSATSPKRALVKSSPDTKKEQEKAAEEIKEDLSDIKAKTAAARQQPAASAPATTSAGSEKNGVKVYTQHEAAEYRRQQNLSTVQDFTKPTYKKEFFYSSEAGGLVLMDAKCVQKGIGKETCTPIKQQTASNKRDVPRLKARESECREVAPGEVVCAAVGQKLSAADRKKAKMYEKNKPISAAPPEKPAKQESKASANNKKQTQNVAQASKSNKKKPTGILYKGKEYYDTATSCVSVANGEVIRVARVKGQACRTDTKKKS